MDNKMGTKPVPTLLLKMATPMILSMMIQALYNTVDSIFVSRLGEDALTAVSLAYPVQNLMIALGAGMAVGINAFISRALGEKKQKKAVQTAWNGLFLEGCIYIIFLIFGLCGSEVFMKMQKVDATIVSDGSAYLQIICIFSMGFFLQISFERIVLAAGKTSYAMIIQLIGAVINIIVDPILIFGWLGFPRMGVAGAAVATVLGQIIGGVFGVFLNQKKNPEIHLNGETRKLDMKIMQKMIVVGIPSTVMTGLVSVLTFIMNAFLLSFSQTAVAFYGIYIKLYTFVQMPITGINNAVVPCFSYNYGAGNKKRMSQVVKYGCIFAFIYSVLAFAVFEIAPLPLLEIFNASDSMKQIGIAGLRIIAVSFLFYGISIIFTSVLQSAEKGIEALIISLCRQLVVLVPIAGYFTYVGNINLVWIAFPIAEFVGFLIATPMYYRFYLKMIKA